MPGTTTAAAQLQKQADQNMRAQERIDQDPEEALAALAPITKVDPSAGQLTMQDVFGLFLQLQKQQAAMQEQLIGIVSQSQAARQNATAAHTREELAQSAEQQRLPPEHSKTAQQVPI